MPSTSVAAEVTVNTRKADRPDPWTAFKRKSTGPTVIPKPKKVCKEVRPKESPDPHICLVCGGELSRGRDFNKKRHWIQKHTDQPIENYSSKIVAKDHELAQKLLQKMRNKMENQNQRKPPNPQYQRNPWKFLLVKYHLIRKLRAHVLILQFKVLCLDLLFQKEICGLRAESRICKMI